MSPTFPEIIFFLLYLFVYFFDGLWPLEMVSLPLPTSTLILISLQFCVFSIPLQAHSPEAERKAGKQQLEALPQYLSPSHSGGFTHGYSLMYKSEVLLYLTEELHDVHTENSVKKRSPVFSMTTAQTLIEIC